MLKSHSERLPHWTENVIFHRKTCVKRSSPVATVYIRGAFRTARYLGYYDMTDMVPFTKMNNDFKLLSISAESPILA